MLDIDAHESPECIERLHKIRDLASSAAIMLQSGECENTAVMRILELENAFAIANRQPSGGEMPRKRPEGKRNERFLAERSCKGASLYTNKLLWVRIGIYSVGA